MANKKTGREDKNKGKVKKKPFLLEKEKPSGKRKLQLPKEDKKEIKVVEKPVEKKLMEVKTEQKQVEEKKSEPKTGCKDRNCPFHGSLKTRGRVFTGTVVSDRMHGTVIVQWERRFYLPKYERYEKRRTKLKAHNPPCINAKEGDVVKIAECRQLSKTKNFVVIEKCKQ